MRTQKAWAVACACLVTGEGVATAVAEPASQTTAGDSPRYNEVRQKSSHNAYARFEPLFDQLAYHNIRSVELDVHTSRRGRNDVPGDWFVYHYDQGPVLWQHDTSSSCERLSDCLAQLRTFHRAEPDHEVVTVLLDWKGTFTGRGHGPEDLDSMLTRELDRSWLVTPRALLDECPGARSVREAVTGACGWPRLESLRGKFVFVLTGGGVGPGTRLDGYVDAGLRAERRVAFIAPELRDHASFARLSDDRPDLVFFNLDRGHVGVAAEVARQGLIARVYGLDDPDAWKDAVGAHAHLLATNKVNAERDPWASTIGDRGSPFTCLGRCAAPEAEAGDRFGLRVDSSHVRDASDDLGLVVDSVSAAHVRWAGFIAVASSHVDGGAEGCLTARASTAPDAPFFSVCRPADDGPLRVRYRARRGADAETHAASVAGAERVDDESPMFVSLRLDREGEVVHAVGEGSPDGARWSTLGAVDVEGPLRLQGVSAEGNDGGPVRFVFGNVRRQDDEGGHVYSRVRSFESVAKVGRCGSLTAFEGAPR